MSRPIGHAAGAHHPLAIAKLDLDDPLAEIDVGGDSGDAVPRDDPRDVVGPVAGVVHDLDGHEPGTSGMALRWATSRIAPSTAGTGSSAPVSARQ